MAIFRKIHVSFWSDSFISELKDREKLFYLYLLTNERTTQLGVYEITKKQMGYDLGYQLADVNKLISLFEDSNKIRYNTKTSEIAIRNWNRYNGNPSSKVQVLVDKEVMRVKDKSLIQYAYNIDTVSIHNPQEEVEKDLEEKEDSTIEFRKSQFVELLKPFQSKYEKEMMNEFYRYWVLPSKKNQELMAFEAEKNFDPAKRLATWFKKSNGKQCVNKEIRAQIIQSWTEKFKMAFISSVAKEKGITHIITSLDSNIKARASEMAQNDIDIGVVNMWNVILQKWDTLEPFLSKQVSFDSIARNFDNILIQMNGTGIGIKPKATIDLTQIRRP